jgi:acyl-CoA-dependent ceramide synthase
MFGIFMLSWFLARHVFYLIIFWSAWTDLERSPKAAARGRRMP